MGTLKICNRFPLNCVADYLFISSPTLFSILSMYGHEENGISFGRVYSKQHLLKGKLKKNKSSEILLT